jgi:hypothetical protein
LISDWRLPTDTDSGKAREAEVVEGRKAARKPHNLNAKNLYPRLTDKEKEKNMVGNEKLV